MRASLRDPNADRATAGFTFVELAVVLTILLVALLIFSNTMNGMSRQRAVNRESALATEAARNQIETMRGAEFSRIFALYNSDPDDDPQGPGTAPGNHFDVANLSATKDSADGLEGEVVFPCAESGGVLALREDLDLPQLGLPRDLSGDSVIDGEDHAQDYFILPVLVRIRWTGKTGVRQYQIATQLCFYNKS